MIDYKTFEPLFIGVLERFSIRFSPTTIALYYASINERLTTEEFVKAAQKLFTEGVPPLPTPVEFIKLARSLSPQPQLPAGEVKAYVDMTPEEQAEYRAVLQQTRLQISNLRSQQAQMSSIVDVLAVETQQFVDAAKAAQAGSDVKGAAQ
ncbi:hypothetical protein IFO70_10155 [Phormidium tenue FACHB-886]|nr:hypothetical protein [Phormidium tenue FACHB-886]